MSPYFLRAGGEQQLLGDGMYLVSIQKVFAQDAQGGMIEVGLSPDERLIFLYLAGRQVAAYRLTPTRATLLDADQAAARIPPDSSLRLLKLPDQATRSVWQALAWYPPVRGAHLDGRTLGAYLDALRVERATGLLQVVLPDMDGFLLLHDGVPVRNETALASAHDFFDSLPNLQGPGATLQGSCDVWLSELRPGRPATEVVHLRTAFAAWVNHWLNAYQHLVGYNLITPVSHTVNTWMGHHRYNIRLIGGSLVDHHLFVQVDSAVEAYRGLVKCLGDCLGQVIGDHLVDRSAAEALKRLKDSQRQVLAQQGIAHPSYSLFRENP